MARMFSLSVFYKDEKFLASAIIESLPESPVKVYVTDPKLLKLIPKGELELERDTLTIPKTKLRTDNLKDCIIKAVQEHEDETPEGNMWS